MQRTILTISIASLAVAAVFAVTYGMLRQQDQVGDSNAQHRGDVARRLAGTDNSQSARIRQLIGTSYPPLRLGFTESGFSTVGQADIATYVIILVEGPDSGVLLGSRRVPVAQSSGEPWMITDALPLPPIDGGLSTHVICGTLKRPLTPSDTADNAIDYSVIALDPGIVALGRRSSEVLLTDLVRVWRVNRTSSRFEDMDNTGIVCVNETGQS